jgi:hypothetical protein
VAGGLSGGGQGTAERGCYPRPHSAGILARRTCTAMGAGGAGVLAGEAAVCPPKGKVTRLRLERKGDRLLASVSEGGRKWTELKALGVAAVSTSTEPCAPHLDGFKPRRAMRP